MIKCIIGMAVYDTEENNRTNYTIATYNSLAGTVNSEETKIIIIDNNSCERTKDFFNTIKNKKNTEIITNDSNIGTAEAINLAMKQRKNDQFFVKIDNDVVIHRSGWIDEMIECFNDRPELGILGLKRKDLEDSPEHPMYESYLVFSKNDVKKEKGKPWRVLEVRDDIIGTCTMFSPLLLDKVGYMYQPGVYGYDDVLMSHRSIYSGFVNAFYPCIDIDHIDTESTEFTHWKKRYAGRFQEKIESIIDEYKKGKNLYYNPFL